ncbi:hypothetical protein [Alkalisalibacterium limincola]|uniref:Uncharacterized protein n=1 Tax=Alkalisalibacterium limincola TaxID=2699169 RepID=A0A5C8KSB0_9GAMM|nr:hypothetical protein [Alkalisalibacterium limincola]TXK62324.1 hypothetical protein FU658_08815 [Alkalisalibacterium limincola]
MAFANNRSLVGVITAMIIWAAWFVLVYALTGVGCDAGWHTRRFAGINHLSLWMLASTAVAVALMAWCAWRGWVGWRENNPSGDGREAGQRQRFLGMVMLILALLAIAGTLMIALPILLLDPCAT